MKRFFKRLRGVGPDWRSASGASSALTFVIASFSQAKSALAGDFDPDKLVAALGKGADLSEQDLLLVKVALLLERPELLGEQGADFKAWLTSDALISLGMSKAEAAELLSLQTAQLLLRLKQAFEPQLKKLYDNLDRQVAKWTEQSQAGVSKSGSGGDGTDGREGDSELPTLLGGLGLGALGALFAGSDESATPPLSANQAPSAGEDIASFDEGGAITIAVLGNDRDPDGDVLTVTAVNGTAITLSAPVQLPGVGSVSLNANGTLTFVPLPNYSGTPSFTYTVSDGKGGSAVGKVNLTVNPVNDAPLAANDSIGLVEDGSITFNVLTNDQDVDGDRLTVSAINGNPISVNAPVVLSGVGTVALNADGTLTFTPLADYFGTPSFTYLVSDGKGASATGTVNLTVAPVNDAPVNTVPGALQALSGSDLAIGGLSVADVDAGNATFSVKLELSAPGALILNQAASDVVINGNGSGTVLLSGPLAKINELLAALKFRPDPAHLGAVKLTVTSSDGVSTDTDSFDITVVKLQSGNVSDGYVAGATVFIDVNGNGIWDDGEPTTETNDQGAFTFLTNETGPIIAFGGVNIDTGLPNTVILKAPVGSTIVNPLTTLVQTLVESGKTVEDATAAVVDALGLPEGLDLTTYDILAQPANDPVALAAQKAATQIVTLLVEMKEAAGLSGDEAVLLEQTLVANIAQAMANGASVKDGKLEGQSSNSLAAA